MIQVKLELEEGRRIDNRNGRKKIGKYNLYQQLLNQVSLEQIWLKQPSLEKRE